MTLPGNRFLLAILFDDKLAGCSFLFRDVTLAAVARREAWRRLPARISETAAAFATLFDKWCLGFCCWFLGCGFFECLFIIESVNWMIVYFAICRSCAARIASR